MDRNEDSRLCDNPDRRIQCTSPLLYAYSYTQMRFCPESLGDRKHLDSDPGGAGLSGTGDKSRREQQASRSWGMNISSAVWSPKCLIHISATEHSLIHTFLKEDELIIYLQAVNVMIFLVCLFVLQSLLVKEAQCVISASSKLEYVPKRQTNLTDHVFYHTCKSSRYFVLCFVLGLNWHKHILSHVKVSKKDAVIYTKG